MFLAGKVNLRPSLETVGVAASLTECLLVKITYGSLKLAAIYISNLQLFILVYWMKVIQMNTLKLHGNLIVCIVISSQRKGVCGPCRIGPWQHNSWRHIIQNVFQEMLRVIQVHMWAAKTRHVPLSFHWIFHYRSILDMCS